MKKKKKEKRSSASRLLSLAMLFYFLAFILLFLHDFDTRTLMLALVVPVLIFVSVRGLPKLFPADQLLLSLSSFLAALGVLVLYRLDPDRGMSHLINYMVAIAAMLVVTVGVRFIRRWRLLAWLAVPVSLGLLALPLLFGSEINGARNWVTLFGFGFQPSELVKLSLVVALAWLLSRKKLVLAVILTGACLGLLMLQKDLGTALLYFGMALFMMYASTGSPLILAGGAVGGAAGAYLGYRMFAHVKRRVAVWLNPWADRQGAGYQIVQGLIAIANGGLWGTGLRLGNPGVIPASFNDYIFTVICHEFGVIFGLSVLVIYLAVVFRGIAIARQADNAFHALLSLGCTVMLGLQTFVIVGGNIKLIPLTGVTLPLISYGGTSLVSSMCLVGIMQGVFAVNRARIREAREEALYEGEGAL